MEDYTLRNKLMVLGAFVLNAIVAIASYSWTSAGHGVPSVVISGWIAVITMVTPFLVGLRVFGVIDLGRALFDTDRRQLAFWGVVLALEFLGAFVTFLIITATFEFLWWAMLQIAAFLCLGAIFVPLRQTWRQSRPADSIAR
jgi:hypothetical protein